MTASPVPFIFDLPWNVRSRDVLDGLSREFNTRVSPPQRSRLRYFDTFDWRLYSRGLTLTRTGGEYQTRRIGGGAVLESARGGGEKAADSHGGGRAGVGAERFWWDFPDGALRERLRGILKVRALCCVGEVTLRSSVAAVLNSDLKTVARVGVRTGEALCEGRSGGRIRLLEIAPVKGYTRDARRLAQHLLDTGLRPAERDMFGAAVVACGREPGDYTSKLHLELTPSMAAGQAAAEIFGSLLDTIERNVDGVINDIDTEFLHDFRVAIRRTRSGLAQLKRILPPGVKERFGDGFAKLGRSTNRLRDLDVYLLSRDGYRNMLDEDLRSGLDPLFGALERERRDEHRRVVDTIRSGNYTDLVTGWRNTLREMTATEQHGEPAAVPAVDLAREVIIKRYGRVVRRGRRITDRAPDTALHALRIECKKLRYLLEFFASLFPRKTIGDFVEQLKGLQDNLGEYNDLIVQQADLKSFLGNLSAGSSVNVVETAAAVGALIAKLDQRRRQTRREFSAAFEAFAGHANEQRFEKLFGPGDK
ncbi:MAG: CHAD domain-containing protein [bacterium]